MAFEFIEGKAMYARVFEHNRDLEGFEGAFTQYDGCYVLRVGVETGGDDFKKIMKWNRMYAPKEVGDSDSWTVEKGAVEGLSYFQFKRKHRFITKAGKEIAAWGGPPKVVGPDGTTLWDTDVLIGNGSDITVKLDVETVDKNRTFVRLEGLRVDNHVPAPEKEKSDEDQNSSGSTENDDEIPF